MNTKLSSSFRLILLAVIFIQATIVQAQNDYQMQMDTVFNIPAYKVTTGILINRSPDIIDMQNFKLQTAANDTTAVNQINNNLKQKIS